jgi:peroxiredoxin
VKIARSIFLNVIATIALTGGALAWHSLATPEAAPAVSYTLLDGHQGHIEAFRGKVVLVNFWATNCTICVAEMRQIVATHNRFKHRSYDTLAVAMSYDAPASVAHFAKMRQLPFGVAIDNTGVIATSFGDVQLTPTTLLIDKHGRIVKRYVGSPDFAALHGLVEKLLAEA